MKSLHKSAVFSAAIVLMALSALPSVAAPLPRLSISGNHRFFVKPDGSPFLYLADTAWGLFHFTREDADLYLKDRAAKKFTVIQATILHWNGLTAQNPYGATVFLDKDPTRPNEAFFQHVDYVVDKAESLGLYMALVPLWSRSYVTEKSSLLDKSSAFGYGRFLGRRYRDKPVIWILGSDYLADGVEDIWRAMAAGLAEGDGGTHLKTYHPTSPRSSSQWFHNDAWLDFNMTQSSHRILNRNYELIAADYARTPVKPVVDGESTYENIADNLLTGPDVPRIQPYHVRRTAYCAFFAGAAGYAYGCDEVYGAESRRQTSPGGMSWKEALGRPGASQMQHVRALMESRPMLMLIPDQMLLYDDPMSTTDRIQACRASDGSFAFIYSASGRNVKVRLRDRIYDKVSGQVIRAYWYDPRQGTSTLIGDIPKTPAGPADTRRGDVSHEFIAPSSGPGNDWVLVLDDASRNFPAPGVKRP